MLSTEATGCVRIIAIPAGVAPVEIKRVWVGLILPCYPYIGYIDDENIFNLFPGGAEEEVRGISVPQDEALAILETSQPAAAAWFREQGFPEANQCFFFSLDEVEILSGVSVVPLRVADDMEIGQFESPGR